MTIDDCRMSIMEEDGKLGQVFVITIYFSLLRGWPHKAEWEHCFVRRIAVFGFLSNFWVRFAIAKWTCSVSFERKSSLTLSISTREQMFQLFHYCSHQHHVHLQRALNHRLTLWLNKGEGDKKHEPKTRKRNTSKKKSPESKKKSETPLGWFYKVCSQRWARSEEERIHVTRSSFSSANSRNIYSSILYRPCFRFLFLHFHFLIRSQTKPLFFSFLLPWPLLFFVFHSRLCYSSHEGFLRVSFLFFLFSSFPLSSGWLVCFVFLSFRPCLPKQNDKWHRLQQSLRTSKMS